MANLLYFASLAEALGTKSETLALPADCKTVANLVTLQRGRGEPFASAFDGSTRILVAINQQMSDLGAEINDSDEIAFFPPVTGG
ncbi:MAG: molybdopterin converting factor subunit 1 [Gammaproteobacteria bacterium]|nr:molybdopterin converting factor subunit 1 [Gammaproteobacteria bacterium]MDH3446654.1 molybdopterin converting factor subunit 1 [Gammaproteobacteria bacterium]